MPVDVMSVSNFQNFYITVNSHFSAIKNDTTLYYDCNFFLRKTRMQNAPAGQYKVSQVQIFSYKEYQYEQMKRKFWKNFSSIINLCQKIEAKIVRRCRVWSAASSTSPRPDRCLSSRYATFSHGKCPHLPVTKLSRKNLPTFWPDPWIIPGIHISGFSSNQSINYRMVW